jgi:hypothetical protein
MFHDFQGYERRFSRIFVPFWSVDAFSVIFLAVFLLMSEPVHIH